MNTGRHALPLPPRALTDPRPLAAAGALRRLYLAALPLLACAGWALAGCGGDVSTPHGAGGGATSSSSTGVSGKCQSHAACQPGGLCVFESGICAPPCDASALDPCGPGLVCNQCATGSCPGCEDCVGACLPASPGQCDDHDDCPEAQVCLYGAGLCAPRCDDTTPACPSPDLVCNGCATGSCPGCDDCVGACVPPP